MYKVIAVDSKDNVTVICTTEHKAIAELNVDIAARTIGCAWISEE